MILQTFFYFSDFFYIVSLGKYQNFYSNMVSKSFIEFITHFWSWYNERDYGYNVVMIRLRLLPQLCAIFPNATTVKQTLHASNTGHRSGACSLIELKLNKDLLCLACHHHVMELVIGAAFEKKLRLALLR